MPFNHKIRHMSYLIFFRNFSAFRLVEWLNGNNFFAFSCLILLMLLRVGSKFIKLVIFLRSSMSFTGETLGIGVTTSIFRNFGQHPCLIVIAYILAKGLLRNFEKCLSIFAGMSFYLSALFTLISSKASMTSFSDIMGISSKQAESLHNSQQAC